jgi:WD40 repeat protein
LSDVLIHEAAHLIHTTLGAASPYVLHQSDPLSHAQFLAPLTEPFQKPRVRSRMLAFLGPCRQLAQCAAGLIDTRRRISTVPKRQFFAATTTAFVVAGLTLTGVRISDAREELAGNEAKPVPKTAPTSFESEPLPGGASLRLGGAPFQGAGEDVVFTSDGKRLVSAPNGSIKFWDIASARLMEQIPTSPEGRHLLPTPDGKRFVALPLLGTARAYSIDFLDANTGKLVSTFKWSPADPQAPEALATFTPDGRAVVLVESGGTVRILDLAMGHELAKRHFADRGTSCVTVSPDSTMLAIGAGSNELFLWEWRTAKKPVVIASRRRFLSLAFSPDGMRLAAGPDARPDVQVFNVKTGQQELSSNDPELQHINASTVAFTPDGKRLVAANSARLRGTTAGAILVWDAHTGEPQTRISVPGIFPPRFSISRDGRLLAASGAGTIRLWELATGKSLVPPIEEHTSDVCSVVFSPDADRIVTTSEDGTARIWHPTGRPIRKLEHHGIVVTSAVSPDGQFVATSALDDTVRLWQMQSGREIRQFQGHGTSGGRRALEFSKEGHTLFSWGDDSKLRIWHVASGKLVREWDLHPSAWLERNTLKEPQLREMLDEMMAMIHCCAFRPGASQLVLARSQEYLIFDTATGRQLAQRPVDLKLISISCDTMGRMAIGSAARPLMKVGPNGALNHPVSHAQVTMIDLESGNRLWSVDTKGTAEGPVVISPDGRIAAACVDMKSGSVVQIYDARNGALLSKIDHVSPVRGYGTGGAFSLDGKRFALAQRGTTVLIWDRDRFLPPR